MSDIDCPWCPQSFEKRENSVRDAEFSAAQHAIQTDDHPVAMYDDAYNQVVDHNAAEDGEDGKGSGPSAADESDAHEMPEAPDSGPETPESPDALMSENPLLRAPIMADGGDEPGDCPDCGEQMSHSVVGSAVRGQKPNGETVVVETEDGDEWCSRCNLLRADVDGEEVILR